MVIKFGPNQTFTQTRDHGKIERYPTGFYTVPGPHHHCDPNERAPPGKKCCCINHSHCQFGLCGTLTGGTIISNPSGGGGGHHHVHGGGGGGTVHTHTHPTSSSPSPSATSSTTSNNTSNLIAMGALIGIPLVLLLMLL